MRNSKGYALPELAVVFVVTALGVAATSAVALPFLEREKMRSSVYAVQSMAQLTRMEAVNRNRETRFVVNATTGQIEVHDTMGTATTADDQRLHQALLADGITFQSPNDTEPITLADAGNELFYATFSQDGVVSEGAGSVALHGNADDFQVVQVYWAGGVLTDRWDAEAGAWEQVTRHLGHDRTDAIQNPDGTVQREIDWKDTTQLEDPYREDIGDPQDPIYDPKNEDPTCDWECQILE